MNRFFLSPSIHHIRHWKQRYFIHEQSLNQNHADVPARRRLRETIPSSHSSSYTSLNSYLKEFHLSEEDFFELRKALQTIFQYTKIHLDDGQNRLLEQRLTSPYLRQQANDDDQSFSPLYTDEYFIRNGLWNHNDRADHRSSSTSAFRLQSYYSSSLSSSMITTSPLNLTLPMELLSNRKYLFNALTSNFVADRSQSSIELNTLHHMAKEDEDDSVLLRRNKVHTWKRESVFQSRPTTYRNHPLVDAAERHQYSCLRTTPVTTSEMSAGDGYATLTRKQKEENKNLVEKQIKDEFFPMVKTLAPYIIIRDSTSLPSKNLNQAVSRAMTEPEKRPVDDDCLTKISHAKRQSLMQSFSRPIASRPPKRKNPLLAEFESVLTEISKR